MVAFGRMFRTALRFSTAAAIARIGALLDVSTAGQDWDVENADAERVEVFCDAYEHLDLTPEERFSLMMLIVASYDDRARAAPDEAAFARIRGLLERDFALHFHTVTHWAALDGMPCEGFAVSAGMREIFEACTPPLVLAVLVGDEAALDAALAREPEQGVLDDALLAAAPEAKTDIVRRLLDAGADPAAHEPGGDTPLSEAAAHGRVEVVALLLARGVDVNVTNELGWTPLLVASMNGRAKTVRLLLAAGADLHVRGVNGYDALASAAEGEHVAVIDALLAAGANVQTRTDNGETAHQIAERHAGHRSAGERARAAAGRLRRAVLATRAGGR